MIQRQKQVSKYRKRYARSIRQKKYEGQRWVLRNVPDHKIYNRQGSGDQSGDQT